MSTGGRKGVLFAVGLLVVLAGSGVLLAQRDDAMPLERATELSAVEPYGVGRSVRFVRWDGPRARGDDAAIVKAIYADGGEELGFELFVVADAETARSRFQFEREDLTAWDEETQQINTFAESEYCARRGSVLRCVGFLEEAPFFFRSYGRAEGGNSDREFDVLGLLRTARKHWVRVFGYQRGSA